MTADGISYEALSLGVVLLLASVGGCFKAASFRGDFHNKWRRRIELAEAGLAEQAAQQLRILHKEIGQRLVQKGAFNPSKATADPSDLIETTERFLLFLKIKIQVQRRLEFLVATGPVFFWALVVFGIAVVPVFGHLSKIWVSPERLEWGLYLGAAALLVLLITFCFYVFLQHRLSAAEIMSAVNED